MSGLLSETIKKKLTWKPKVILQTKAVLPSLSMDKAVQTAYKHKPVLLSLKHRVRTRKIGEKAAWSGYYPHVTFSSTISGDLNGGTSSATALSIEQLILDLSGPQELYKKAKHNTVFVKLQEREQQDLIRYNVEKTFLECWKLQRQRELIDSIHKASRARYDEAQHKSKVQLINRNEWLTQVEEHANNMTTVHKYEDGVLISQKLLEFFMGYALNLNIGSRRSPKKDALVTKLAWSCTHDVQLKPLVYYLRSAQDFRPEIKKLQKAIDIIAREHSIITKSRFPKLFVGATAGHNSAGSNNSSGTCVSHGYHNYRATVSWNVFDGAKTDYDAQITHSRKLEAMLKKQELVQVVKSEVQTTYHQMSQSLVELTAEKFKYLRAKNEFAVRSLDLSVGNISPVDFEQAKKAWNNAQFSWFEKRVAAEVKHRELLWKCGYLT